MVNRKLTNDLDGNGADESPLPKNWDAVPSEGQFDLTDEPNAPIPIKGRIVRIVDNTVWVDAGRKNEIAVDLDEWKGMSPPQIGDEFIGELWPDDVEVQISRREPDLSDWHRKIEEQFQNLKPGDIQSAVVFRRIKGGFVASTDNGLNAYLPYDSVPQSLRDNPAFVGQRVACEIVGIDASRRNITVKLIDDATTNKSHDAT